MNTKINIHTKIPNEYKEMVDTRLAEFDSWNPTDQRFMLREIGIVTNRNAFWQQILIFAIEEWCKKYDKQIKPGHWAYPLTKPIAIRDQPSKKGQSQVKPRLKLQLE